MANLAGEGALKSLRKILEKILKVSAVSRKVSFIEATANGTNKPSAPAGPSGNNTILFKEHNFSIS